MTATQPLSRRERGPGSGFTLIEVLVTVTIMGIAAAIVVPAMLQPGTLHVQAAARMIMSDLLLAQNDAIAMQRLRKVAFSPDLNRYTLTDENDQPLDGRVRGAGVVDGCQVDLANDGRFRGVTLASTDFNGSTTISFNELGTPSAGGTIEVQSGAEKYRIRVADVTGQVSVHKE